MGLLIFQIDHFVAQLAFPDVSATIGLVKINSVAREEVMAVLALFCFVLHYQQLRNI
jgi:hypothetical protein